MRTRVIPAQVTTIEDKIAGNLNFTQILLLVASVLFNTAIYIIFPESMKFNLYKIILITLIFAALGTLAMRIKNRVVLNWLILLFVYYLRPRVWIFDKNNTYLRTNEQAKSSKSAKKVKRSKNITEKSRLTKKDGVDYSEIAKSTDISIRFSKKGLLGVKEI